MEHRLEAVFAPAHDSSLTLVKGLDRVLAVLRRRVSRDRCERSLRSFASLGHHGLLVSAGLGAVFALTFAVTTGEAVWIAVACAWPLLLLPLHYLAAKLGPASEGLVTASPCRISSLSLLDGLVVLDVVIAFLVLPGSAWLALQTDQVAFLWTGLCLFVVCLHLAGLALHPVMVQTAVVPSTTAIEEALGLLAFFSKGLLKLVPAAFGTAALLGTLQLLSACVLLLHGEAAIQATRAAAGTAALLLFAAALLPLVAYLLYLAICLPLQLLRVVFGNVRR